MPLISVAGEQDQQPDRDEQVGEALAERRREARRPVAVAGHPPGDRPRDPAAVEREGRDQVEDQDEQVDARRARRASPAGPRRRRSSIDPHRGPELARSRRPRSRSRRRVAAIARVTTGPAIATLNSVPGESVSPLHPGDAAEQPQRDLGDRDPVADRDHGVAELVQEDRGEEEERAGDREQVGVGVGVSSAPSTSW